jgi:hypothetical protein
MGEGLSSGKFLCYSYQLESFLYYADNVVGYKVFPIDFEPKQLIEKYKNILNNITEFNSEKYQQEFEAFLKDRTNLISDMDNDVYEERMQFISEYNLEFAKYRNQPMNSLDVESKLTNSAHPWVVDFLEKSQSNIEEVEEVEDNRITRVEIGQRIYLTKPPQYDVYIFYVDKHVDSKRMFGKDIITEYSNYLSGDYVEL